MARLSRSSFKITKKTYEFFDAVLAGFWLGVLSEKSLDYSDELSYNNYKQYTDDKYNQSGLFKWEKAGIEKYFKDLTKILLLGAGGGRETLALSKMGFKVDSYECNIKLINYGNELLQKNKINSTIKYLPRNSVPDEVEKYDGIIIGWGAYSHIRGRANRLSFLASLYPFLKEEAPLMISFLLRQGSSNKDKIVKSISSFFRIIRNKIKTEPGDRFSHIFLHYFTEKEIKEELQQSKYRVIGYNKAEDGCVVAVI